MIKKRTSHALFALGFAIVSANVYAGATATNSKFVTVPTFKPGYEFSFALLGLKPGASNLNYVIYNKDLPAQSPTWTEQEIRPRYSAAFEFGIAYDFTAGENVSLDWTHLKSTTTTNVGAPNDSYFLGPDYEIGPDAIPIHNATGEAQFKYDVINLDFGQFVNFGDHVQMRFFGGLSNAYLREIVTATYTGTIPASSAFPGPFSTQQQVNANFTGLGPRIGVDGNYTADNGFGVMGEGAISALIGSSYAKTNYVSSATELQDTFNQSINPQFIRDQNVTQVVPGLDGKLGITYKHTFRGMILTLVAGYQGAVYINAINQYLPGTLVSSGTPLETGGIFVGTMNHTQSNYSVQGPFFKATVDLI